MATRQGRRDRLREALISGLIATILLIGIVWNLPDSAIKRALMPALEPIALETGLDQRWQMYAPDPIRRLETVEVRVTMADGGERVWTQPRGGLVTGPFAWYHWQKLKENAVREPGIRAGIAQWVARTLTEPSARAVRVQMILRTQDLPPPGHDGPTATTTETLYDEDLSGRP